MYRKRKVRYKNLLQKPYTQHYCKTFILQYFFKENETLKPMYFVYDDLMLCKHCIFK